METVRSRSISIRIRITIRTTTTTSTGSVVSVHDLTIEDVTMNLMAKGPPLPQPSPPEEEREKRQIGSWSECARWRSRSLSKFGPSSSASHSDWGDRYTSGIDGQAQSRSQRDYTEGNEGNEGVTRTGGQTNPLVRRADARAGFIER
jgi:hypothetical protein